jgi:hypothetical protein
VETTVFSTLVLVAFGLMLLLSGGIIYLTIVEWRDRRRRNQDSPSKRKS